VWKRLAALKARRRMGPPVVPTSAQDCCTSSAFLGRQAETALSNVALANANKHDN